MCGICGKLNFDLHDRVRSEQIRGMLDTIRHRGPDDEGIYVNGPVGLGHRRLSIIDLKTGHQPLSNEDHDIWVVFNGEIYNFRELRAFLEAKGHIFRTNTDTEVIVHLYEELGPACLDRLRGMFAIAIWDEKKQSLFLARDRAGIKPLYYCFTGSAILFASEMKAILADPSVRKDIAPEVIDRFLTFNYVPGVETLFKDIRKLAPGSYLLARNGRTEVRQYWDLHFTKPAEGPSLKEAERHLDDLLGESVDLHMIADVPVGVLLSGGVDSTGVLSYARERTNQEISTYTVGFGGNSFEDERPYARLASNTFGTRHYDMTISAGDFAEFMPRYVWHMEEPVCEPPAIALYYVSKLARDSVKVLLSGEGGDEAFAGYSNYRNLSWLERLKKIFPPMNRPMGRGISAASSWAPRLAKYGPLMTARFPDYYYSRTANAFSRGGNGFASLYCSDFAGSMSSEHAMEPLRQLFANVAGQNVLDQMLYIDTKTWLPDDLLIKADRMTMANSLELRVPLLDHVVLEFAASLPASYKISGTSRKYILKKALSKRVPQEILNRKKAGFPVPYESWLRREFKEFTRDILLDSRSLQRGYFRKTAIEGLIEDHADGRSRGKQIFSLLTLELWHRMFLDASPTALPSLVPALSE